MLIVVGYVDRPEGHRALEVAAEEAKLRGARLVVVSHVEAPSDSAAAREHLEHEDERERELERIRQDFASRGIDVSLRSLVSSQDPGAALVKLIEEEGAELAVLGMRSRSRVGKLLLGSVAQTVLLEAPCPVLTVKA